MRSPADGTQPPARCKTMKQNLTANIRQEWLTFLNGVRFFTRIHIPDRVPYSNAFLARAATYLPAIGLFIGAFSAVVFSLALTVLPQTISILLAMVASLLATGAFHEDGLSDTADGLGGGWDKDRILAIMKDSRVGTYGVVAITTVLLLKFACLSETPAAWVPALLISGHAFSRYCAVLVMSGMDYVRTDTSSKAKPLTDKLTGNALIAASVFGLLPLMLLPFPAMLLGLSGGLLATIWIGRKLQKWLGGYTGDCLGAVQQLSEVAFYLGVLATLH